VREGTARSSERLTFTGTARCPVRCGAGLPGRRPGIRPCMPALVYWSYHAATTLWALVLSLLIVPSVGRHMWRRK